LRKGWRTQLKYDHQVACQAGTNKPVHHAGVLKNGKRLIIASWLHQAVQTPQKNVSNLWRLVNQSLMFSLPVCPSHKPRQHLHWQNGLPDSWLVCYFVIFFRMANLFFHCLIFVSHDQETSKMSSIQPVIVVGIDFGMTFTGCHPHFL
jgi:hypothetical protein